jgi:S-adenosylmethionine:diacylglycerol 3-amino-3-carboxypropyl transferase
MYEDNLIERSAFRGRGKVFCIASAGCTALALCEEHEVVACDINPAQIEYVKRRLAGGARELGTADKVMRLLHGLMPMAGFTRTKLEVFLALDSPDAQVSFFRNELDTWRFRVGLALLLSPSALRAVYSPALLSSLPTGFAAVLRKRMERCFALHSNRSNPYARALLLGLDEAAADPAQEGSAGLSKIDLVCDDAASYLERSIPGSFDAVALSNILDGAGASYRERLVRAVRRATNPDAAVVLRSFGEPPPGMRTNRAEHDRSMLWGVVDVRPADTL